MFLAIILAVVVLVAAAIGYTAGVAKGDGISKTRNRQYKDMVREVDEKDAALLDLRRRNSIYETALRDIASGRSLPEVTASIALKDY